MQHAHHQLIPYLYLVSSYFATFAVYVLLPHTLCIDSSLGSWFPSLLPHICQKAATIFKSLLAQAFRHKNTRLSVHLHLLVLLQSLHQGYDIIYSLACHAQHLGLQEFLLQPKDVTLPQYLQLWAQHAQHMVLQGHFYYDCYFYQWLYHQMHPVFYQSLG